jgi:hypothetical protein
MSLSMRATPAILNPITTVGSAPVPAGNLEGSLLGRLAQALEDDRVGYTGARSAGR